MFSGETTISDRVLEALLNDDRTRDSIIDVSGERGTITLSGNAPSQAVVEAAEEIARRQDGVVNVINELRVG